MRHGCTIIYGKPVKQRIQEITAKDVRGGLSPDAVADCDRLEKLPQMNDESNSRDQDGSPTSSANVSSEELVFLKRCDQICLCVFSGLSSQL